ncbi:MAG TPA: response regulator, partial [Blastocatellia bacterium]
MSAMEFNKTAEILLVDRNTEDARLTCEAFNEAGVQSRLRVAREGREAIRFLRCETAPRPDLILLDLSLPKRDDIRVIEAIREDRELKDIPVVVLTTSDAVKDILDRYNLEASCFFPKPMDIDQFISV